MFTVFHPEGSMMAAMVQNIPQIKVDPATRINQVQDSGLVKLHLDNKRQSKESQKKRSNMSAYEQSRSYHGAVTHVDEIMRSPVTTIQASASIEVALHLMQLHNIKHLPVMIHTQLVGIVNLEQVLSRVLFDKAGKLLQVVDSTVKELMTQQVISVHPKMDIRMVAEAMMQSNNDAILIMEDVESIQGIVTHKDLIQRISQKPPIQLYV
jgi:CBS domain-containing protein